MSQKIFLRHTRNLHPENEQLKMDFLVHKSRISKNLKKFFFLLLELLAICDPDIVGLGKKADTIVYRKDFEKFYFYVECVQRGRKRLAIQTLYKMKKPPKRT